MLVLRQYIFLYRYKINGETQKHIGFFVFYGIFFFLPFSTSFHDWFIHIACEYFIVLFFYLKNVASVCALSFFQWCGNRKDEAKKNNVKI